MPTAATTCNQSSLFFPLTRYGASRRAHRPGAVPLVPCIWGLVITQKARRARDASTRRWCRVASSGGNGPLFTVGLWRHHARRKGNPRHGRRADHHRRGRRRPRAAVPPVTGDAPATRTAATRSTANASSCPAGGRSTTGPSAPRVARPTVTAPPAACATAKAPWVGASARSIARSTPIAPRAPCAPRSSIEPRAARRASSGWLARSRRTVASATTARSAPNRRPPDTGSASKPAWAVARASSGAVARRRETLPLYRFRSRTMRSRARPAA